MLKICGSAWKQKNFVKLMIYADLAATSKHDFADCLKSDCSINFVGA
ncbi:hypothetical protein GCK32_021649, partial [Trichostrongylus colubriformis]